MHEETYETARPRSRGSSTLEADIKSVEAALDAGGYAKATISHYRLLLRGFARWLDRRGIAASDLDEEIIEAFLDERRGRGRSIRGHRAAIRHLVVELRRTGSMCPPEDSPPSTPADLLLDRYARYLREERGLAHATILNYRPLARLFLCEQFGDGELRLVELGPTAICSFLLGHAQSMSTGRAQLLVTTLRSLFRFLLRHGEIDVDLAAAVPPVRVGHRFVFAKHLPAADVEHLLDTCDLGVSTGLRNRAIFLLLARLGLRASEIVTLELDDIDWRAGEIAVSGKGRIRDRLPLVHEVGEAVAAYLLHGRPSSKSRRLFLRSRAPHRGFAGASTVSTLVRRALIRADLNPPRKGAHLLRHSLAMGMLDRGASMAEIGQLLRHRSATATEIYAHVDIRSLRSLAQPWPAIWSLR